MLPMHTPCPPQSSVLYGCKYNDTHLNIQVILGKSVSGFRFVLVDSSLGLGTVSYWNPWTHICSQVPRYPRVVNDVEFPYGPVYTQYIHVCICMYICVCVFVCVSVTYSIFLETSKDCHVPTFLRSRLVRWRGWCPGGGYPQLRVSI